MSVNENVLSAAAPIYEVTERYVRFTHFPVLDGLRGIAVLLVMACHLEFVVPQLRPLVKGGFLGVDIFFVLSGFLITSILLREQDKNGRISLKNFYLRRFLRLTPAFWMFLASLYFLGNYILPRDQAKIIYEGNDFLYSLLYVINWDRALGSAAIGNLNHTWSLAIEEQFYIGWSVCLCLAFSRRLTRQNLVSFLSIFILVLVLWRGFRWSMGADLEALYYATDTRIDGLLIGCLASMLYCWRLLPNEFFASRKFGFLTLVSLIIALTILLSFSHQDVLLYLGMTSVFSLAIAVMILRLIATGGHPFP
jgi:peptidoglycan/LPS O-acetylase OafA/YrhL